MQVQAKIKVIKADVNLERNCVYAEVNFVIANMQTARNTAIINLPLTDELKQYVQDVIVQQVGELVEQEEQIETIF